MASANFCRICQNRTTVLYEKNLENNDFQKKSSQKIYTFFGACDNFFSQILMHLTLSRATGPNLQNFTKKLYFLNFYEITHISCFLCAELGSETEF